MRLAYRVGTGGAESSGVWTNATHVVFMAYRNVDPVTPIAQRTLNTGAGTNVTYYSLDVVDVDAWAFAFAGVSNDGWTPVGIPDFVSRAHEGTSTGHVVALDTSGPTGGASFASYTATDGGTATSWLSVRGELTFLPPPSHTRALPRYTVLSRSRLFARTQERAAGGVRVVGDGLENPSDFVVRAHVDGAGDKYLSLPGSDGNFASTPDAAVLDITGDIQFEVDADIDWLPSTQMVLVDKGIRYRFIVAPTGLRFQRSLAGTFPSVGVTHSLAAGRRRIRATFAVATGTLSIYEVVADGTAILVGANTDAGTAGALETNANSLMVGARVDSGGTQVVTGAIYRAQVFDGIGGTLVADFDANRARAGATTVTATTGETWTIHQAGNPSAEIVAPYSLAIAMTNAYDLIHAAEDAGRVTTYEGAVGVDGITGYAIEPVGMDAHVTLQFAPTSAVIAPIRYVLAPRARGAVTGLTPIVRADDVPATAVTYDGQPVTYDGTIVTYGGA